MFLVSREIALKGIQQFDLSSEWPFYLKFVGLRSFRCVSIGPGSGYLHGDLLLLIRNHVEAESGKRLQFTDADVFEGCIEFEEDFSFSIRTMTGKALEFELELEIQQLIEQLRGRHENG
jgi:hypothetical protein